MDHKKPSIWVITQGIAGTENQCLGIAEALGGDITIKRIDLRWPYRLFSPFLSWGEGPGMLTKTSDSVTAPYPDVVIAGGRRAVGIARYIKRASKGKTIVVMVQNPKISSHYFDVVAAPYHDGITGPNVIVTDGACNRITPDLLQKAAEKWAPTLNRLPTPRTAVLIGGASKHHHLGPVEIADIIARIRETHTEQGGSLMITVSRRTPAELTTQLVHEFSGPNVMIYTGNGDNPYHGFLAYADYVICTNDSVSMISDVATTGKPLGILPLAGGAKRHHRFMDHLADLGVGAKNRAYVPFADAIRVADAIKTLLETRYNHNQKIS